MAFKELTLLKSGAGTAQLINDGDGDSPFATEAQVFDTYKVLCAPAGFDPTTQPINIIEEFKNYSNINKRFIYSTYDDTVGFRLENGDSYRIIYGAANNRQFIDVNHAQTTFSYTKTTKGNFTHLDVISTDGFPSSGIVFYIDGYYNAYRYFIYTSKTATSFIGASQFISYTDFDVRVFNGILKGAKTNVVIIVNKTTQANAFLQNNNEAKWLYCGNNVNNIDAGFNTGIGGICRIKYIHYSGYLSGMNTIYYSQFWNSSLEGNFYIPPSVKSLPHYYDNKILSNLIDAVYIPKSVTTLDGKIDIKSGGHIYISRLVAPTTTQTTFYNESYTLHRPANGTGYNVAPYTSFSNVSDLKYKGDFQEEYLLSDYSRVNTFNVSELEQDSNHRTLTDAKIAEFEGKEDTSNKKTDIESNKTSNVFYAGIKAIYDWATGLFVQKNASITGGTKTKVTYDSKGLVTGGEDAGISDITGLPDALDTVNSKIVTSSYVTSAVTTQANYTTGKFLNASGVVADFANSAVSVLDATKLLRLIGGSVYNVTVPFVTDGSANLLLDSNLATVTIFSVTVNDNVAHIGSNLVFTVDLTNKSGFYYLRFTLPYSGGVVNTGVTVTNKSLPKIGATIKNNLRNQFDQMSDMGITVGGTYGSRTARYRLSSFITGSRLSAKFRFQNNINYGTSSDQSALFLYDLNINTISRFGTRRNSPTQTKQQFSGSTATYIPYPTLNSGYSFNYGSGAYVINQLEENPILGEKLFMIWLKGSKPSACPTQAEIESKSTWLNTYQDLCIDVSSDTFSIKRDGIAVDDSVFNGGSTSTIFSTSLKTGGNWKTIQALYAELVAATVAGQVLENFYVEFFNLSANLTCSSILQFGKLKLVGNYQRQVIQNTGTTDATFGYKYDSYPCFIYNNVDYREHVMDIVNKGSLTTVYVDGIKITDLTSAPILQLGTIGSDIWFYDVEYNVGHLGDAEIVSTNIISERTPRIIGLMGHTFADTYEGSGTVPTYGQSITRLADVTQLCKNAGYKFYSASEIASGIMGEKQLNKRAAFFMFDDANVGGYLDTTRLRNSYGQYGAVLNMAIIMNTYYSDVNKAVWANKFASMRLDRNDLVSHSKYHDVPMPNKDSVVLYWELEQMQMWAEELHVCPTVFTYNWSGKYFPVYEMLNIKGYNIAIQSNQEGGRQSKLSNRYLVGRISISDADTTLATLNGYIV